MATAPAPPAGLEPVMSDTYGGLIRPALRGVADEPDQVPRLQRFRAEHRDVIIGTDEFGNWQGRIPEPTGETVTIRCRLSELLDRLDELTGEHQEGPGAVL
jgi:hypothetical protein